MSNKNVIELFHDSFSHPKCRLHPDVSARHKFGYVINNHSFEFIEQHATYYIPVVDMPCNDDKVLEYEMSIRFSVECSNKKNPDARMFIGTHVYDVGMGYHPKDIDSGLWLGIDNTQEAVIMHGISSQWPLGVCNIKLPVSFTKEHTLTIVNRKGVLCYYVNTNENELSLFCKIDVSCDILKVFDGTDNCVYAAPNNLKGQDGYLKIFSNYCHTLVTDVAINKTLVN